ncbi:acid-sensing ion channel 5-like [Mytilus edulis]|uniref:acid-sensing ion channel 5-like n=1 Tax=Mytilus edulis TaxID=6550 RepID=UPI0039F11FDD
MKIAIMNETGAQMVGKEDKKHNDEDSCSEKDIWTNFTQTTGFHGLNKITFERQNPRQLIRSICWIIVWLICAVFLIYTVIAELKNYYSYPTISNTYIQLEEKLSFPTVTICNMSPRSSEGMKKDVKTNNLYMTTSALYTFSQKVNWSDPFYKEEGYFEAKTKEDLFNHSKNIWESVYLSLFDNVQLKDAFSPVYTDMGLCLRFNSDGSQYTAMYGAIFNLQLYVNVMTYFDYFSHSLSSGVKIAVHDHRVEPIMTNEGLVIKPASEAFIEIRRKDYKFLPAPYTAFGNKTCVNKPDYSSSRCYQTCWNEIIQHKCGCTDFLSKGNGPYCSYHDYQTCSNPTFWHLLLTYHKETCDCPQVCHYTTYEYSFSTGTYPSEFFVSQLSALTGFPEGLIRTNFALIRIYFKDLSITINEQVAKYENAGDIFANLGGQLGLFLGASILTITELLEFIIFLIWSFIHRVKNRGRDEQRKTNVEKFKQTKY